MVINDYFKINSSLHNLIVTCFLINALKYVCLWEYWIKAVDEKYIDLNTFEVYRGA